MKQLPNIRLSLKLALLRGVGKKKPNFAVCILIPSPNKPLMPEYGKKIKSTFGRFCFIKQA